MKSPARFAKKVSEVGGVKTPPTSSVTAGKDVETSLPALNEGVVQTTPSAIAVGEVSTPPTISVSTVGDVETSPTVPPKLKDLIDTFKAKVEAAADDIEIDRAFFAFVGEFAADRAATDYLALEEEARAALGKAATEDLRERFIQRVGAVRADFAKAVVETLDHKKPADREPYWYAAVHEHELAFDHLLRTVRGEGRC